MYSRPIDTSIWGGISIIPSLWPPCVIRGIIRSQMRPRHGYINGPCRAEISLTARGWTRLMKIFEPIRENVSSRCISGSFYELECRGRYEYISRYLSQKFSSEESDFGIHRYRYMRRKFRKKSKNKPNKCNKVTLYKQNYKILPYLSLSGDLLNLIFRGSINSNYAAYWPSNCGVIKFYIYLYTNFTYPPRIKKQKVTQTQRVS